MKVSSIIICSLLLGVLLLPSMATGQSKKHKKKSKSATTRIIKKDNIITTASGLQYEDIVTGTGDLPIKGKKVYVVCVGTLSDGKEFWSSVDRSKPFPFTIGVGQVIKGWDEGISTMQVGGKRKLIIPPQLAYGESGFSNLIPPNATLIYDIELLGVEK